MERYTEAENIASEYRKNYMDGLTAPFFPVLPGRSCISSDSHYTGHI